MVTALGGMPVAAARATRGTGVVRQQVPRTSRTELVSLLRRKAWQVDDLKRHPVCLGVPLGQNGGEQYGVSVDIGLKSFATVGVSELVDASPGLADHPQLRAEIDPLLDEDEAEYLLKS